MKAIKKLAAVLAAATVTVGAMAVSAFADDSTYKLYVESEKAGVGDVVPVSIVLDSNETVGIGGFSFTLNFNTDELELQADSITDGEAIGNWIGDQNVQADKGTVTFAYTTAKGGLRETGVELFTLSFKVLKVNASLTFTNVDFAADDDDGTDLTDQVIVAADVKVECSHKNTESKTEVEDCEKGGKTTTTCKDCNEVVKTEDVAPTDHTVDKWTEIKKATCTEKGEEEGVCTVCGKTVTRETDMIDHSFGEWVVTTPATCTEKGVETSTCAVCGEAQTREIDALGHDFGEWTVVKPATCTEKGTEERTCSRCDEKETREIDMIDHNVEWKVTKEATCTEAGEKTGTCTVCGDTVTEEIPALGHDWGEWTVVEEATTEKEGSEERECSRCGEKETRAIDKLAPVETDETTSSPEPAVTTSPSGSGNDGSGNGNPATGVALAVIPLIAAGAAAVVFCKKRK